MGRAAQPRERARAAAAPRLPLVRDDDGAQHVQDGPSGSSPRTSRRDAHHCVQEQLQDRHRERGEQGERHLQRRRRCAVPRRSRACGSTVREGELPPPYHDRRRGCHL